jgi:peptidoglycan/LPS O-acetylase OafA/YrhL
MSIAQPATGARFARLDALRGVAILLVLGRHQPINSLWTKCGWAGVDLFFVLSGFLVAGLIFKEYVREGSVDLFRFWSRRAFRIYPPFLSMLAGSLLLCVVVNHKRYAATDRIFAELTWTQSYRHGIWGHTWSLAVEEHFYILLPLVLAFAMWRNAHATNPFRSVPSTVCGLSILFLVLRSLKSEGGSFDYLANVFPTHLRLDSLAFGVLLSYLYYFRNESFMLFVRRRRRLLLIGGVLLFSTTLVWPLESTVMHTVGFTFVYVGSGCFLALALLDAHRLSLLTRALAGIGGCSYSIYLWHMAINQYTPTFIRVLGFGTSHRAAIAVSLGLSVVAGFVMHRLIELPAIRLRDYLLPSVRVRERNPGPVEAIRGEATGEICSMASTITLKNA